MTCLYAWDYLPSTSKSYLTWNILTQQNKNSFKISKFKIPVAVPALWWHSSSWLSHSSYFADSYQHRALRGLVQQTVLQWSRDCTAENKMLLMMIKVFLGFPYAFLLSLLPSFSCWLLHAVLIHASATEVDRTLNWRNSLKTMWIWTALPSWNHSERTVQSQNPKRKALLRYKKRKTVALLNKKPLDDDEQKGVTTWIFPVLRYPSFRGGVVRRLV